jgi:tripartite-type tricarboxylate transporter receptor subunit TctC
MNKVIKWSLSLIGVLCMTASATAQEWPSRTITLIAPFAAGGSTDVYSRAFADFVRRKYGYTIVVDNRPGAGGFIGTNAVQTAAPDGYTIGHLSASTAVGFRFIGKELVLGRDVDAVAQYHHTSLLTVVNPSVNPSKTFADLIQYFKDHPGTAYTTFGVGSVSHMLMTAYAKKNGLDVTHIPYKGGAPATTALLGGEIGVAFGMDPGSVIGHIQSGRLVALASSGKERTQKLPNLPTTTEAGFPELSAAPIGGLIAPHGTPPAIMEKLSTMVEEAVKDPAFVTLMQNAGTEVKFASGKQFQDQTNSETEMYAKIMKEYNIKVD